MHRWWQLRRIFHSAVTNPSNTDILLLQYSESPQMPRSCCKVLQNHCSQGAEPNRKRSRAELNTQNRSGAEVSKGGKGKRGKGSRTHREEERIWARVEKERGDEGRFVFTIFSVSVYIIIRFVFAIFYVSVDSFWQHRGNSIRTYLPNFKIAGKFQIASRS